MPQNDRLNDRVAIPAYAGRGRNVNDIVSNSNL
jgi:hypothetical protein